MSTPKFDCSKSDAQQHHDTRSECKTTPIKQSLSQSEGDGKSSPSLTPVKLEHRKTLECTPTKRKRESGEGSGHDATVKKSPSVLDGQSSPLTPVKLEHLETVEYTPTKRKREPGEGSGHDATVKKSPSVLDGQSSPLTPVKLEHLETLEYTPTEKKRELGEGSGHDATVKKSPSVLGGQLSPLTPVKLEHLETLEYTPTEKKRESGEGSGHDATVKKSPSVLGGQFSPSLPGTAKSSSVAKVKRQLNFSQGEIKEEEEDAGCSDYDKDISHQEGAEAVIKKEEDPVRTNEHLADLGIPEHISRPEVVRVERNDLLKFVAFGVETTHLEWDCDIIQLECSDLLPGRENFCVYIKSKKKVHRYATKVNGLTNDNCILKQNGETVHTVSLEEGVMQFIHHLQENTILISHNMKGFHQSYRLLRNILREKKNLLEGLREKVVGFSDSYRIFRDLYPKEDKLPSYKLLDLIDHFSEGFKNQDFREPIDGIDNVMKIGNLAELLRYHAFLNDEKKIAMLYKHSLTIDSALEQVHHLDMQKSNEETFALMVSEDCLKKNMAQKMASSGLTMENLQRVFELRGKDGILELLNPRITKNQRVIDKIVLYLKKHN
ncbi:uncharacterized protein [Palaemon carinicauda]|uniref:uncharacterized protein n=1 Tax=Palaemon carinicauda TaxID=392227 RepID=UPI0035B59189